MPIKVQGDLPAKEILERENIFVMDENRAMHQDIRPIQILIVNLMPLKEETELQLLRSLSNTPLQIDVTFLTMNSHESKNTSTSHLNKFYLHFQYVKENKYDDEKFFHQYSQMSRSMDGLKGAGEWHALQKTLPDFQGKRVLDLGCGFGWHCQYAIEHGAVHALGIDLSHKMLEEATKRNNSPRIEYKCMAIEDFDYTLESYDIVISSLTFHYLESFPDICEKVRRCLTPGGTFVFSVEHPVFTAYGSQDWYYDEQGNILHWPVDRYFSEGKREAIFLGENVTKFHKTLTTYVNGLIQNGFEITGLVEPEPDKTLLDSIPGMRDELRRPMMLIISSIKK